jgi:hypothetical protein
LKARALGFNCAQHIQDAKTHQLSIKLYGDAPGTSFNYEEYEDGVDCDK